MNKQKQTLIVFLYLFPVYMPQAKSPLRWIWLIPPSYCKLILTKGPIFSVSTSNNNSARLFTAMVLMPIFFSYTFILSWQNFPFWLLRCDAVDFLESQISSRAYCATEVPSSSTMMSVFLLVSSTGCNISFCRISNGTTLMLF